MNAPKPQKPIHKTPPITLDNFQAGYLKPMTYSPEDLSKAMIDLLNVERAYTEPQMRGLRKFKQRGSWNLYEPADMKCLKIYFDIFNDMFFNGVLTGYCTMSFFEPTRKGWFANVEAYCETHLPGREHDPRFRIERPSCHISLQRQLRDKYSPEERVQAYQESLLHEMLHAVFAIYTCRCESCLHRYKHERLLMDAAHHGPWLQVAHAIEIADKAVYQTDSNSFDNEDFQAEKHPILELSLEIELGREVAVAAAVHGGANLPPEVESRRLGLDFMKVWRYMQMHRDRKAKASREEQRRKQLIKLNRCVKGNWIADNGADFIQDSQEDGDSNGD